MNFFDFREKHIIIDIGTRYTKALSLEGKDSEKSFDIDYSIEDSSFEFNFLPLQECKITDEENFLEVLRLAYSKLKTMEKNVFVTIPDHAVIIRLITIKEEEFSKAKNDDDVRNLVLKKLKPTLPISIDRWFFDLQEVENSGNSKLFLVEAILRNNLFEIEKNIRRLGLNPIGVDINSFNTVNVFSNYLSSENKRDKNISIVCMNHKSTTIMVFRNGNLRTAQTRLIGGYDFARKLSEEKNISFKDGEDILRNETVFLPELSEEQDNIKNYSILKPVFSELVTSLFNMFEYYSETFKESEIHEIIITGGFSNLKNIHSHLSSRLNIKVNRGSDIISIKQKKGSVISSEKINMLLPALGSAIREES